MIYTSAAFLSASSWHNAVVGSVANLQTYSEYSKLFDGKMIRENVPVIPRIQNNGAENPSPPHLIIVCFLGITFCHKRDSIFTK
jgi:hypothetical protein